MLKVPKGDRLQIVVAQNTYKSELIISRMPKMCAIPLLVRLMLLIQGRVACRTFTLTGHILTYHKKTYVKLQAERRPKKTPTESRKTKIKKILAAD